MSPDVDSGIPLEAGQAAVSAVAESGVCGQPWLAPKYARHLRGDLHFMALYRHTTRRVLRYRPHAEALSASELPTEIADRIESSLAHEVRRYRALGWCILGLLVTPPLIAAVLWSAMYWLPYSIYWWPFERGLYGLPYFSLFEWLCYLALAGYFVTTSALLYASYDETGRLGTEYRRLLDAPPEARAAIAGALADGAHPRSAYVVRKSPAFAEYGPLIDAGSEQ